MTGHYVLGDWGTTRLRLHRLRNGIVFDRLEGPGIGALDAPALQVLMNLIAGWRAEDELDAVILCGMAGARGGLVEAAYVPCPAMVPQWREGQTRMMVDGLRIAVVPGLSYRSGAGVPDVMRGEETQIFGAITLMPALAKGERTIILPGTHSKWASLSGGVVTAFRTSPTGEIFSLLSRQSTLIGPDRPGKGSFGDGFAKGFERRTQPLATALFEARASRMLDGWSQDWARGFLSGLLIGSEIHAQAPADEELVLIGDSALVALYARALSDLGFVAHLIDGEEAALAGLELARGKLI